MAIIAAVEDGKVVDNSSTTTSSKAENSNELGYDQFLQLLCAEIAVSGSVGADKQYRICSAACNLFPDGSDACDAEHH